MPPEFIIIIFVYGFITLLSYLLILSNEKDILKEWKGIPEYLIHAEQILATSLALFYLSPLFGYGEYSNLILIPYIVLVIMTIYFSFIKRKTPTFTYFWKKVMLTGNKSYLYGILSIVGYSVLVYLTFNNIYP